MSLYFRRRPGLYATSGEWSDPFIWTDRDGNRVNRVPGGDDDVYILGDVTINSGEGLVRSLTVGTIADIGGFLIKSFPEEFYAENGAWNDPATWYNAAGEPMNKVPDADSAVFIWGEVTNPGTAAIIVFGSSLGELVAYADANRASWAQLSEDCKCCCNVPEFCCYCLSSAYYSVFDEYGSEDLPFAGGVPQPGWYCTRIYSLPDGSIYFATPGQPAPEGATFINKECSSSWPCRYADAAFGDGVPYPDGLGGATYRKANDGLSSCPSQPCWRRRQGVLERYAACGTPPQSACEQCREIDIDYINEPDFNQRFFDYCGVYLGPLCGKRCFGCFIKPWPLAPGETCVCPIP